MRGAGHDVGALELLFHPGVARGVEGAALGRLAHGPPAREADGQAGRDEAAGGRGVRDHHQAQELFDDGACILGRWGVLLLLHVGAPCRTTGVRNAAGLPRNGAERGELLMALVVSKVCAILSTIKYQ
ncbi:hypothetical protein D3C72_1664240 [compost metagenome]